MKQLMFAVMLGLAAPAALAGAKCDAHPKDQWMKETDLRKQLKDQGYKIRKFKVDGNCYEIYGHDKQGRKVEIYFDTVSGNPVKTEIH